MKKYEIVRRARGEESVEASGDLPKMRRRLAQLRASTQSGVSGRKGRKYPVSYELRLVEKRNP